MARLLIIDDDIAVITLIKALLENSGHEVFALTNSSDVKQFLKNHQVDAVLCDLIMPDLSGWEVYEYLRSRYDTIELPVLFVSGTTNVANRVRGIRSRYCDFINKPFEPAELMARLEKLINSTATDQDLHGDFSTFSFEELAQSLEQNQKTGHLDVLTERSKGRLSFHKGAISEAQFDDFHGSDAFISLIGLDRGHFWFRISDVDASEPLLSVQSWIMKSVYWRDELERVPYTLSMDQKLFWRGLNQTLPKELDGLRALDVIETLVANGPVTVNQLFSDKIMAPLELKFVLSQLHAAGLIESRQSDLSTRTS